MFQNKMCSTKSSPECQRWHARRQLVTKTVTHLEQFTDLEQAQAVVPATRQLLRSIAEGCSTHESTKWRLGYNLIGGHAEELCLQVVNLTRETLTISSVVGRSENKA